MIFYFSLSFGFSMLHFLIFRVPPRTRSSTFFPYTTLFRSRNMETLRRDGIAFVGPNEGDMACGEFGLGRMAEPEEIFEAIEAHRSEEHTSELQSRENLVCHLLLEKKNQTKNYLKQNNK